MQTPISLVTPHEHFLTYEQERDGSVVGSVDVLVKFRIRWSSMEIDIDEASDHDGECFFEHFETLSERLPKVFIDMALDDLAKLAVSDHARLVIERLRAQGMMK